MKIGVATSSFAYWVKRYPSKNWEKDQLNILKMLNGKIDAVEIHLTYKSIKQLSSRTLIKYQKYLKPFKIKTIHLGWNKKEHIEEREFNRVIKNFMKATGTGYGVVHMDDYLNLGFKPKFQVAIENLGHGKEKGYPLKTLNKIKKPVVIDIEHTEGGKIGTFDKEIKKIKNKVVEIHFSVPKSKCAEGNRYGYHHLAYNSGFLIPKKIPKNALWIIEGVIPKNRWDLFEKEIELIEELKNKK